VGRAGALGLPRLVSEIRQTGRPSGPSLPVIRFCETQWWLKKFRSALAFRAPYEGDRGDGGEGEEEDAAVEEVRIRDLADFQL